MEDSMRHNHVSSTLAILLSLSGEIFAAETTADADVVMEGEGAVAVASSDVEGGYGFNGSSAKADATIAMSGNIKRSRAAHCFATNAVQTACHCEHEH